MVDFSSHKRSTPSHRGSGLLIAAICIIGFVGYALLETTLFPTSVGDMGASLTESAPT